MRTTTLAVLACLLGVAAGSGVDTLWVTRLNLGYDEYGQGIASRGNAIAVAGICLATSTYDWLAVRLNQDGDTIWTRTYDAGYDEQASSTCLDAESNVLVAGVLQNFKAGHHSGVLRRQDRGWNLNALASDQELCALTAKYDSLGELKWFRTDTNYMAVGIAVDSAGNSYVSGTFFGGTYLDLWLAKLNPAGETIWTRTYDFDLIEIGYRVAFDSSGNLATCAYVGDLDNFDCLTLRFTPDGDTIWTRRYDRGPDDACTGVAVDPGGNIIVAGRTVKDTTASDALVLKYDSSGVLVWDKAYDFDVVDGVAGAACDSAGNIYVAGQTGANDLYDCLTMKLDSTGGILWTTTYGGLYSDGASDVACDTAGNPIIAGYVTDTTTANCDLLVAKYSPFTGVTEPPRIGPAPVPARRIITAAPDFVLSVPSSGRYDVRLCDVTGRTRLSVFSGYLSQGAHRFSLVGQPAGSYFVRVAAPSGGVSCQGLLLLR